MSDVDNMSGDDISESDGSKLDSPVGSTVIMFKPKPHIRKRIFEIMKEHNFATISDLIDYLITFHSIAGRTK